MKYERGIKKRILTFLKCGESFFMIRAEYKYCN